MTWFGGRVWPEFEGVAMIEREKRLQWDHGTEAMGEEEELKSDMRI